MAPSFNPASLGDSLGLFIAHLPTGVEYIVMAGCEMHMCGAGRSAAAIEGTSGEVFLLEVTNDLANPGVRRRAFFGRNDSFVRNLLMYVEEQEGKLLDQVN